MRVVWVHPSWRDLVIEHLIADTSARERFLRRCGINGAVLALSIAGGTTGERRLPLLVTDEDWDVLADRVYELAPDLEEAEQSALVDALSAAVEELEGSTTESEIRAFAQTVLSRISRLWGAAHAAVPLHLLEAWLALARDLAPSPDPAGLVATWAELLPADAPAPDDRDGVRHLVDWLTLVGLLRDNTPEVLAELGFPDRTRHVLNRFIDSVDARINDDVWPAADAVRAVVLISALHPTMRGRYLAARLQELLPAPVQSDPPTGDEEREVGEPELFDIDRVLRDL